MHDILIGLLYLAIIGGGINWGDVVSSEPEGNDVPPEA